MDFAAARIVEQLFKVAHPVGVNAARFGIVIATDYLITQPRLVTEALEQRLPFRHISCYRHITGVIAAMAQHTSAIANKRAARQHADGAEQVPRQPHGKVGIKIIVKRQQPRRKHQAQRPVLQ